MKGIMVPFQRIFVLVSLAFLPLPLLLVQLSTNHDRV